MELNDEQLMRDYNQGKEEAFKKIYKKYFKRLAWYSRQRIGNNEEAKDIAIKVLAKLFILRPPISDMHNLGAYLTVSMMNLCNNKTKNTRRRQKIFEEHVIIETQEGYINTLEKYDMELAFRDLDRAAIMIRNKGVQAVYKCYYERKCEKDIAREMGVSVFTVKNLKKQGIETLRRKLRIEKYII